MEDSKFDALYIAKAKLGQDWSADTRAGLRLPPPVLIQLVDSFDRLDALVKVRLLLAGLLALNAPAQTGRSSAAATGAAATTNLHDRQQQQRRQQELLPPMQRLVAAAKADDDGWVKLMGAALGRLDGQLDLQAVEAEVPAVADSMSTLRQLVTASSNQHLFPPLENQFLHPSPPATAGAAHHFRLRPSPGVPLLSAADAASIAADAQAVVASPRTTGASQQARRGIMGTTGEHSMLLGGKGLKLALQRTGSLQTPAAAAEGGEAPGSHPRLAAVEVLGLTEARQLGKMTRQAFFRNKSVAAAVHHLAGAGAAHAPADAHGGTGAAHDNGGSGSGDGGDGGPGAPGRPSAGGWGGEAWEGVAHGSSSREGGASDAGAAAAAAATAAAAYAAAAAAAAAREMELEDEVGSDEGEGQAEGQVFVEGERGSGGGEGEAGRPGGWGGGGTGGGAGGGGGGGGKRRRVIDDDDD